MKQPQRGPGEAAPAEGVREPAPAGHTLREKAYADKGLTPAQQADPALNGPAHDADGDGLSNAVEFALAPTAEHGTTPAP